MLLNRLNSKYRFIFLIIYYLLLIIAIVFKFFKREYLEITILKEYNNYKLFYFTTNSFEFFIQSVLNVVSFIPLGILLLYNIRKYKYIICSIILLLTTISFEIIQLEFKIGVFDINDIFFNFIGGLNGFIFYTIFIKIEKNKIIKELK